MNPLSCIRSYYTPYLLRPQMPSLDCSSDGLLTSPGLPKHLIAQGALQRLLAHQVLKHILQCMFV